MKEKEINQNDLTSVSMLELKVVKKIYETKAGTVSALNGVSLTFPERGMVFITGKSGCGKTTMLNLIGGLDGVDEGEISVLGKSFSSFSKEDYDNYRNTFIGFIFQEYNLLSEFTVEKNIKIAMELQGREVDEEEYKKLLRQVEIEELEHRKPSELSGGQRQRVAIARALVKNPRIIMADEPTGALDSNTGVQVLETLKKLSKDKLVIVVSHDLELSEKYADRIIRLVDGEVAEDVTFTENEIESNVNEKEDVFIVRDGAELSVDEKDALAIAIRERKRVEIIENLTYREKEETGVVEKTVIDGPVKLQKSKMKIKSSVALGMKSLGVKPLRLIFTIILSAMAFAVFGLFDTVASFSSGGVIANLLRTTQTETVSAEGKFVVNERTENEYSLKISEEALDSISKESGAKVKGIFDLNYNRNGVASVQFPIIEIQNTSVRTGSGYYADDMTGFIEFEKNEIDSNGYISGFNYKVLEGYPYPELEYDPDTSLLKAESMNNIGISTYMAESIIHYLGDKPLGGKEITEIKELIGCKLTINGAEYRIVTLIDCGDIPSKYDALKTSSLNNQETRMLSSDFTSFINSGAHKCIFVASGFLNEYKVRKGIDKIYYGGDAKWTAQGVGAGIKERTGAKYLFSSSDYTQNRVMFFDESRYSQDGAINLKDDEVLIDANNLDSLYGEVLESFTSLKKSEISSYIGVLASSVESVEKKKEYLEKLFDADHLGLGVDGMQRYLDVTKLYETGEKVEKRVRVVGFYFGMDTNIGLSSSEYRFMANDNLLSAFEVYTEQGDYSRIIFPTKGAGKASSVIANYMTRNKGFALKWYSNSALSTIEANEQTIKQAADLFLYIALVLAAFSIFMLFNYITTSIISKRQTIGVLRGLGSNGKDIFMMFISESVIIAILNGVLACILAYVGCIFVNSYIIETMNISISFALFDLRQILIIFGMSIFTAVISSVLPIIKISKEKPVDLIRRP